MYLCQSSTVAAFAGTNSPRSFRYSAQHAPILIREHDGSRRVDEWQKRFRACKSSFKTPQCSSRRAQEPGVPIHRSTFLHIQRLCSTAGPMPVCMACEAFVPQRIIFFALRNVFATHCYELPHLSIAEAQPHDCISKSITFSNSAAQQIRGLCVWHVIFSVFALRNLFAMHTSYRTAGSKVHAPCVWHVIFGFFASRNLLTTHVNNCTAGSMPVCMTCDLQPLCIEDSVCYAYELPALAIAGAWPHTSCQIEVAVLMQDAVWSAAHGAATSAAFASKAGKHSGNATGTVAIFVPACSWPR